MRLSPFFLYVHYMDVHDPYLPSEHHAARFSEGKDGEYVHWHGKQGEAPPRDVDYTRALYDACIRSLDDRLAVLEAALRERKLWRETLFVVVGDHGEEFYEHEGLGHGHEFWNELVRVPLLLAHSSLSPQRIDTPVSLTDVLPTLLDLAGLTHSSMLAGQSLAPLIGTEPDEEERPLFMELGPAKAVRLGRYKLIRRREGSEVHEEFFDLAADPREKLPLSDPAWGGELRSRLDRFAAEVETRPEREHGEIGKGSELEKQLRVLGYLGGDE
jgi:arylsulfatase A-like enzyme